MRFVKNILGPLYPIAVSALLIITLFLITRACLVIWQSQRLGGCNDVLDIFRGALRIDISSICYLLLIPALISTLFLGTKRCPPSLLKCLKGYTALAILAAVFMEALGIPFIQEYDLRPNRIFIEYLVYPREVLGMLAAGYKLEITLIALIMCIAAYLLLGRGPCGGLLHSLFSKPYPATTCKRAGMAAAVVVLGLLGARGTLDHR